MYHITFDLETLGNTSDAPITQIAAVKFTRDKIIDRFNRHIRMSYYDKPEIYPLFRVNYDTIKWWFKQEPEAIRNVHFADSQHSLPKALAHFDTWINEDIPAKDTLFWTHSTFDPPVLTHAYKILGKTDPIPFRNHRDLRTLHTLNQEVHFPRGGVLHDARVDAENQAEFIMGCLQKHKYL